MTGPRAEIAIGLALLIVAGTWGTVSWNRAFSAGVRPAFYQDYFEPAVMIACGHGFAAAVPEVPAVGRFLRRETDRITCDQIPAGTVFQRDRLFQKSWWYLMYAVGATWRVLGVSWSGMGPLFGSLFAATVVAAYAIFRLGMSRILALGCSAGLSLSPLHLMNLPRLRDYSKAPFTLVLVFLLGLLVTRRATRGIVLAVAAAYGIVLGAGYGFRTDFLANIPPFFLTLGGFLEGGVIRNLRLKLTAAALCLVTFVVIGWPIVSAVYRTGGCQWHVALLGFSARFSRPLGVEQPPYQLSRVYSDGFVATTVTSYAARTQPGVGPIEYCTSEYDVQTGRYLRELALRFPADMIVRAYASILRIVELAFTGRPVTPPGGNDHAENQAPGRPGASGPGFALVVVAAALALGANLRIGLFLLFFLLYFGGYPAIQFDARHHFHLEFITWWAAGFVLQTAIIQVRQYVKEPRWDPVWTQALKRAGYGLAGCALAMAIGLWAARAYQQASAGATFGAYLAAESDDVLLPREDPWTLIPIVRDVPRTDPETAELLRIDVNAWECGEQEALTFRYDPVLHSEFWRTVFLNDRQTLHEPTHILMPVYEGFRGIERAEASPGCISRIARVRNPGRFSLLLEAVLPPQWETRPLYQRLGAVGFPDPDGTP
jgi:hypothetical protein